MPDNIPDWLKESADKHADDVGFRVPYDGSNKFYDDNHIKWAKESFIAGVTSPEAMRYHQSAGRWVKASEGLPDKEGDYFVIYTTGEKMVLYASGTDHHSRWKALVYEWLDETPSGE